MTRTPGIRSRSTGLLAAGLVVGLALGAAGGWGAAHQASAAPAGRAVAAEPSRASTAHATSVPTARPATLAPTAAATGGIPAAEAPGTTPQPSSLDLATTWTAPTDLPATGRLLRVTIPATRSHFAVRQALLYLPPAALTADPPALPVDVLLSGQSRGAGPDDVQTGGQIERTMDALATLDRGLAPVVVVPDQLGPQSANPMCVDGKLGNSRTYLTQDVPAWVTSHLRVQTAASAWTIGGFSQGGTCAIQLGAGDPARFGNLIDVSGEDGPSLGSVTKTITEGFAGNRAAWAAAQPAALLRAGAPFRDSNAFFAAGALDTTYGPVMPVMAERARAAGMHVATWVVPGGRHSWVTARAALAAGLDWLQPRVGLGGPTA
ncbi:alpha/beta hydrolase [Curtobacterium sp. B18]|uniref:alpha/beta hydrolase n=1 Tax=Curtobacterium sp. B18 TaxID=95614 RepID=UPI000346B91E|nr:alpha/beta hydrolase-fold protein [Curtobacterium sp. B18]